MHVAVELIKLIGQWMLVDVVHVGKCEENGKVRMPRFIIYASIPLADSFSLLPAYPIPTQ